MPTNQRQIVLLALLQNSTFRMTTAILCLSSDYSTDLHLGLNNIYRSSLWSMLSPETGWDALAIITCFVHSELSLA